MPVDLHRHLEGSVRFETFVELAKEVGLGLSRAELRRRTTMRGEKPGFPRFLSKFALYYGLYPSREWIERVAYEAAEDARKEGVERLELRFSPTHFGRRIKAKGEDVAEWISRAARRAHRRVTFIATFGRHFGVAGNRPTTRAVEGTDVFSALDLAGDERAPVDGFVKLFRRLKLPATIHAGEAGGPENVRHALERFGASRIGHGLRVMEDPALVEIARARGTVFEVCLTSELQTGVAPSWRRHPALRMLRAGLGVTINTDDPSVCGTTLPREFARAKRAGFTAKELAACAARARKAVFR